MKTRGQLSLPACRAGSFEGRIVKPGGEAVKNRLGDAYLRVKGLPIEAKKVSKRYTFLKHRKCNHSTNDY